MLRFLRKIFLNAGILPFLLVALLIFFSLGAERFMTASNMLSMGRQTSYLAIITAGQMLVILCAGFDLSVGFSVALTSVISSIVMVSMPGGLIVGIVAGIAAGIGTGALVGVANGVTIAVFRVSPFVVTLGMMSVTHGVALLITRGVPIFNLPSQFNRILGVGKIAGLPIPILIAVLVFAIVYILLNRTRIGRYFYALGSNVEAAHLSGISVMKYTFLAYVLCGVLTGLTGVMLTARVGSGEPNLGAQLPLESIAAAVIGGVSLSGGEGGIIGAVFGSVLIVLIRNGMDLMNISSFLQMVVMGLLLIFAVVMDQLRLFLSKAG